MKVKGVMGVMGVMGVKGVLHDKNDWEHRLRENC